MTERATETGSTDDARAIGELSGRFAAIDLDPEHSARLAARARANVGRGPSPLRFIEPVLVVLFTSSFLVWTVMKVLAVLR